MRSLTACRPRLRLAPALLSIAALAGGSAAGSKARAQEDFEAITASDISSVSLSSDWIRATDDAYNLLPDGEVVVYRTDAGRLGKLRIVHYGLPLRIEWVTFRSDGTVYRRGNPAILGGSYFDLDDGAGGVTQLTRHDFRWSASASAGPRDLIPLAGSGFAVYDEEFDAIDFASIEAATLSPEPLDGGHQALSRGGLILYRTSEGRPGKLKLLRYGFDLLLKWTTYTAAGGVHSRGSRLSVLRTRTFDLDAGAVVSLVDPAADFRWRQLSNSERRIEPRNGAEITLHSTPSYSWRVSVKFVLDSAGNRSAFGNLNSDAEVRGQIASANDVLCADGGRYTLDLVEIVDLAGLPQWFNVPCGPGTRDQLEAEAKADPGLYAWRDDAINVYVLGALPGCGGICSFPVGHEIILLAPNVNRNTLLHEIGHFFGLCHTQGCPCGGCDPSRTGTCHTTPGDDGISDTLPDLECWTRDDVALSSFGAVYGDLDPGDQAAVDDTFSNVMSYHLPGRDRLTHEQVFRMVDTSAELRSRVVSRRMSALIPCLEIVVSDVLLDLDRLTGLLITESRRLEDVFSRGGFQVGARLAKRLTARVAEVEVSLERSGAAGDAGSLVSSLAETAATLALAREDIEAMRSCCGLLGRRVRGAESRAREIAVHLRVLESVLRHGLLAPRGEASRAARLDGLRRVADDVLAKVLATVGKRRVGGGLGGGLRLRSAADRLAEALRATLDVLAAGVAPEDVRRALEGLFAALDAFFEARADSRGFEDAELARIDLSVGILDEAAQVLAELALELMTASSRSATEEAASLSLARSLIPRLLAAVPRETRALEGLYRELDRSPGTEAVADIAKRVAVLERAVRPLLEGRDLAAARAALPRIAAALDSLESAAEAARTCCSIAPGTFTLMDDRVRRLRLASERLRSGFVEFEISSAREGAVPPADLLLLAASHWQAGVAALSAELALVAERFRAALAARAVNGTEGDVEYTGAAAERGLEIVESMVPVVAELSAAVVDLAGTKDTASVRDAIRDVISRLDTLEARVRETAGCCALDREMFPGPAERLDELHNQAIALEALLPRERTAFVRGDCNGDRAVDLSDVIFNLSSLFTGGPRPLCLEACEVNDDTTVDLSDAVYLLGYLFHGASAPEAPFPACGEDADPERSLGCNAPACE